MSTLAFNGIDARTGEYLLSLDDAELVAMACGEQLDAASLGELKYRKAQAETGHYGVTEGVDVRDLSQTGWGVVFAATRPESPEAAAQAAIREALQPLLELRRTQATRQDERLFRVYAGPDGLRPGEGKQKFLARHGAGPGPADPKKVPYYLLLVGDPGALPYRVQQQLGVQRAVGRLHFDTVEEYAAYARSVVAAETGGLALPRRASFFGVANPDDGATQASARHLVAPLADSLAAEPRFAGWEIERCVAEQATRGALADRLAGREAPALLFAASHGMGFPKGDPLQVPHQGALLCQEWPGPRQWKGKIPEEHYLAGDHLSSDVNLLGNISFLFACYGAGSPELDEFSQQAFKERAAIAPHAFVAGLPRAMLNRPRGGALAVVGHVERAWGHSFLWEGSGEGGRLGRQIAVFESAMRALMGGMPVGAAMEYFHERYAELASDLAAQLEERDAGIEVDEYALAAMWTASNDARGYAILGDPAVRLPVVDGEGARAREDVGPVVVTGAPGAAAEPALGSYGIVDRLLGNEKAAAEPSTIERFVARIGETLGKALDEATTLEVSTYVADDLGATRFEGGKVVGGELRAYTRVSLDGDTVVCLPKAESERDQQLLDMHAAMVRHAQQARADLLATLVQAASSLAGLGK